MLFTGRPKRGKPTSFITPGLKLKAGTTWHEPTPTRVHSIQLKFQNKITKLAPNSFLNMLQATCLK